MITCSYRSKFNNYFTFLFYKITIKLSGFYKIQIIILRFICKISKDPKIIALYDYIQLLENENYYPDILSYPEDKLSKLDRGDLLDIYDLCRKDYPKEGNKSIYVDLKDQGITYIVEKSGFFSTIFTVITVSFYCKNNNSQLNIDWTGWEYDYEINSLFESDDNFYTNSSEGQGKLFLSARKFIDSLQEDSEIIKEYESYRYEIIKKLYDSAKSNYDYKNISLVKRNYIAAFIRRGDKIINESYPIDLIKYYNKLKKYQNIVLLGDDYYFNESLSKMIPSSAVFEITGYKPRGGYLNNNGSEAVKSIINNFIILCDSDKLIGDPYCNLVAAALVYRKEFYSDEPELFPWKLRNYV